MSAHEAISQHGHPAPNLIQLPETVLVRILRLVPQQERLTCCALASRALAAAATATTAAEVVWDRSQYTSEEGTPADQIAKVVVMKRRSRFASFQAWLEQHAQQVVKVTVSGCYGDHLQLRLPPALPRLQQLSVTDVTLELSNVSNTGTNSPGDDITGLAAAAGGSTGLSQRDDDDANVASLAVVQLPQLTTLHVWSSTPLQSNLVAALLQQAPQLAVLKLEGDCQDESALAPLSTLQQLRCCWLYGEYVCRKSMAMLQDISTLKELRLDYIYFTPADLARLSQVESLVLNHCALLPTGPWNNGVPVDDGGRLMTTNTTDLLAALSQLQHLKTLEFMDMFLSVEVPWEDVPALTTLSTLEAFRAHAARCDPPLLPRHALQHLLPVGGAQLQGFTALELVARESLSPLGQGDAWWCVDAGDLAALAASCPNLARLQLHYVLQPCLEAVRSLVRLQQQLNLPWLSLAGRCVNDDTAAELGQMGSLRSLRLADAFYAEYLTEQGVEHLTALRQLTDLQVRCKKVIVEPNTTEEELGFSVEVQNEVREFQVEATRESITIGQPDVWSQLDKVLDSSPVVGLMRLQRAKEAAQQHGQQVSALQQQVSALQQLLAMQQEELGLLRFQLQLQQEQQQQQQQQP